MGPTWLKPNYWAEKLLKLPDGRREVWVFGLNLSMTFLALTVGRHLGTVAKGPFTAASPIQALFSNEIGVTLFSFAILLISGQVLFKIYHLRLNQNMASIGGPGLANVWWWMAIGFFFLAADELLFLHEGFDRLFHLVFRMKETAWSDRLDDLIPMIYAAIGLGVMYRCRDEFKPFTKFWPWLGWGMVLMMISQGLDALTNRKDVLTWWLTEKTLVESWWHKLTILEEGFKLLAEGLFLIIFLRCHDTVRMMPAKKLALSSKQWAA